MERNRFSLRVGEEGDPVIYRPVVDKDETNVVPEFDSWMTILVDVITCVGGRYDEIEDERML